MIRWIFKFVNLLAGIIILAATANAGGSACIETTKSSYVNLNRLTDMQIQNVLNGGYCLQINDKINVARELGTAFLLDLNNMKGVNNRFNIIYVPMTNIPLNTEIRFQINGGEWADGRSIYLLMQDPVTRLLAPVAMTDGYTDCFTHGSTSCWPMQSGASPYIRFVTNVTTIPVGTRLVFSTNPYSIVSPVIVANDPVICAHPDYKDRDSQKYAISIAATYASNFSSPGVMYQGAISLWANIANVYQQFFHDFGSSVPATVSFQNKNFFVSNTVAGGLDSITPTKIIHKVNFYNRLPEFDFPVELTSGDQLLVDYTSSRDLTAGTNPAAMHVVAYNEWNDGGTSPDTLTNAINRTPMNADALGVISTSTSPFVNRFYAQDFYPTLGTIIPDATYGYNPGIYVKTVYFALENDSPNYNMYTDYKVSLTSYLDFGYSYGYGLVYGTHGTNPGLTSTHSNIWIKQEEQDLCSTTYDMFIVGNIAPIASIVPISWNFGSITSGTSSAKTITLTNNGAADLVISSATVGGNFGVGIGTCGTLPKTLAPTANCTITATFSPITSGAFSSDLNVTTNDPITPKTTVVLSGTGTIKYNILPAVTTGAATAITVTGATLNGTVNANNSSTVITFEYGTTTAYGSTVDATPNTVAGSTVTAVSSALTGLTPNTLYHYRVKGVSSAGTSWGSDLTFTAGALPILSGLTITSGPTSVNEKSTSPYTATATWSDGSTTTVTPTWSVTPATYASINSSTGLLSTLAVTSNQSVTVTASFTAGGVTKSASKSVTIIDVPFLTALTITGPASMYEGDSATYRATANWDDGSATIVTPTWSITPATYATINSSSGVLTTRPVPASQTATVTASFTANGITKSIGKSISIINVPYLTALTIIGPASMNENASVVCSATATWDDGSTTTVTPIWSVSPATYATINSANGLLTTRSVSTNQSVTVTASFTAGGITKTISKSVIIVNVPYITDVTIIGPTFMNEGDSAT